jgi:hypothetical protein
MIFLAVRKKEISFDRKTNETNETNLVTRCVRIDMGRRLKIEVNSCERKILTVRFVRRRAFRAMRSYANQGYYNLESTLGKSRDSSQSENINLASGACQYVWYTGEGAVNDVFQTHITNLVNTTRKKVLAIIARVDASVTADISARAKFKNRLLQRLQQVEIELQTHSRHGPYQSQKVHAQIDVVQDLLTGAASQRSGIVDETTTNVSARLAALQIQQKTQEANWESQKADWVSQKADLEEALNRSQEDYADLEEELD